MRFIRLLIISLCLCFVLVGCSKPEDPPDNQNEVPGTDTQQSASPNNSVSNPLVDVETRLPESGQQDSAPGTSAGSEELEYINGISVTLEAVYFYYYNPTFYPVNEDTLNAFREQLQTINEDFKGIQFNIYSIEPRIYGYSVATTFPLDPRDNPYYVWFEVMPDDQVTPRVTVVSTGNDGVLSYKGAGVDYTDIGFGDDIVKFLTNEF